MEIKRTLQTKIKEKKEKPNKDIYKKNDSSIFIGFFFYVFRCCNRK